MLRWGDSRKYTCCNNPSSPGYHHNLTQELLGMNDLPKGECRNRKNKIKKEEVKDEVVWFRLEDGEWWPVGIRSTNHAPQMPPLKFKRRYKAKWVDGKRFNQTKLRRNLVNMGKLLVGMGLWCAFWWLFGKGITN